MGNRAVRAEGRSQQEYGHSQGKCSRQQVDELQRFGYFLYRLMRAIPELCTCLKNFRKSVRRLWYTQAPGNSRHVYPPFEDSDAEVDVTPKRIRENPPPGLGYTSRRTHVEATRIELVHLLLPHGYRRW